MRTSGLEGAGLVSILEEEEFSSSLEIGTGKPESGFGLQEAHGHACQVLTCRVFGGDGEVAVIRLYMG